MTYFWLVVGIAIAIFATYKGLTEGFENWTYYYLFSAMALVMFVVRKFMLGRMEKHMKYLAEKEQEQQNS